MVSSEVITAGVGGHDALAGMLAENSVNVVICGGMGSGAQNALAAAGIEIYAGAEGDADAAVETYLNGDLVNSGVNCHEHDHEEEAGGCGCGSDCGCGSSCGGGCGGCGGGATYQPPFDGPNVGKVCVVNYEGTLDDGSKFDSSYDRGETLEFLCGAGMMITGFDKVCASMEVGDVVEIHLEPEDAYGQPVPEAILTVNVNDMPGSAELEVGAQVYLQNMFGQPVPARVTAREGDMITFDANHEMAGKALNFKIEMVEIREM